MIRVLVVGPIRFSGEALGRTLAQEGLDVVDVASTPDEAIDAATRAAPDVVLLDVTSSDGTETLQQLAAALPAARIVAAGIREVDAEVLACVEAGATGYVPADASIGDLVYRLRRVVRDEPLASPHIVATMMRRLASLSANGDQRDLAALTRRELDVLRLIETGLSNKEIASRLSIEVTTVKNHVHSILEKLSVRRRGEAAALVRAAALRRRPESTP
jgi:two-component system, NarL family, nitrate/nitrite response regulator NarL